jgi:signal peptidase
MEPTLQPGDLAIARCGAPQVGDVVAYRPFPDKAAVVIHRIVGGDAATGWLLQGDNNNFVDPFRPVAAQVKGTMVMSVPKAGSVLSFLGAPLVWVSMLLIAGAILLWPGRVPEAIPDELLVAYDQIEAVEDRSNEILAA